MGGVLLLFIPIIINEVLDLFEHRNKSIVACGIPGNETFSLKTCLEMEVYDCSNVEMGSLQWNTYDTDGPWVHLLFWSTLMSFVCIILMVEYSLLEFIGTAQTMLKLLTYRIYVGVQKRKFVPLLIILVVLFLMYAGLKFFTYYELSKDSDIQCKGRTVRIRFINDYEDSLWKVLVGVLVMATILKDPWWKMVGHLFNFYSQIDLKVILREGPSEVLTDLSKVRKIEYADLLDIFDQFLIEKYAYSKCKRIVQFSRLHSKEELLSEFVEWINLEKYYLITDIKQ